MRITGRKTHYIELVGSSSEHRTKAVLLPHTLKAQPVRTEKRLEGRLFWKFCRVEYTHFFSAITMDVVQKPYISPASRLHIPGVSVSWSIYSKCPWKREGASTWGWEGKADLHWKAMKAFGSSAQPDSMLSYLSGHIYYHETEFINIMGEGRLSDGTNFLGCAIPWAPWLYKHSMHVTASPLKTSLSWPSLPLCPTLSESSINLTFHFWFCFCQPLRKLLLKE